VEAGGKDALRSDLARLQVEILRRREERAVIVQELLVSSAELARLIRLDPRIPLAPVEHKWSAVPMPGAEWLLQEVDTLIAFALQNRPEIAESLAYRKFSVNRERNAKLRPLLPQVQVGYFAGGFGGGPVRDTSKKVTDDLSGPIDAPLTEGSTISRFGPRTDFAATLNWQLQGLGFGNVAEVREARAVHAQAEVRVSAAHDRVRAQVVQAHASLVQNGERLWTIWEGIADKEGKPNGPVFESIRLNFERIRGGEGRPLEALDSVRGLNDMMEAFANGLSEYDRSRFRILVVLGIPSEGLTDLVTLPPTPRAPAVLPAKP
jgi:hypothetical protein